MLEMYHDKDTQATIIIDRDTDCALGIKLPSAFLLQVTQTIE